MTTTLKLGKRAARHDRRTLRLAKYIGALPPPPASVDWSPKIGQLGPMLNSELGDCTCAGAAHMIQCWTGNAAGSPVVLPDAAVLAAYEQFCGYNPADPSTDQGGVLLDILNKWRGGFAGAGHAIDSFTAVNVLNRQEVMQGLNLFGGLYCGVLLPVSAQTQVGQLWDVVGTPDAAPGSWGGHCVPIVAANEAGLTCVTWGALQTMSWAFWDRYFDEAFAVASRDWIEASGLSPGAFDLAALEADLAQLAA